MSGNSHSWKHTCSLKQSHHCLRKEKRGFTRRQRVFVHVCYCVCMWERDRGENENRWEGQWLNSIIRNKNSMKTHTQARTHSHTSSACLISRTTQQGPGQFSDLRQHFLPKAITHKEKTQQRLTLCLLFKLHHKEEHVIFKVSSL